MMRHRLVIEFDTEDDEYGDTPSFTTELRVADLLLHAVQLAGHATNVTAEHYYETRQFKLWASPPKTRDQLEAEEAHQ